MTIPTGLSMDNPRGKKLYLFDRSLMERLSDSGLAMSKLNVQRRMRPSIAELMRYVIDGIMQTSSLMFFNKINPIP